MQVNRINNTQSFGMAYTCAPKAIKALTETIKPNKMEDLALTLSFFKARPENFIITALKDNPSKLFMEVKDQFGTSIKGVLKPSKLTRGSRIAKKIGGELMLSDYFKHVDDVKKNGGRLIEKFMAACIEQGQN